MSPGLDFQEAFLFMYSDAIMLILGVTLAVGVLLSLAKSFMLIEPGRKEERAPEIDYE